MKRVFAPLSLALLLSVPAPGADEPVVAPPEAIVVEGVPKVPASLAEDVGRYTEFREAAFSSWHPKRHEMIIATRFGNVTQAHLVQVPGGARTQLTFYPDRVSSGRFDPKTGDTFVFSKDIGGNEFFQLYRYDFADGKTTLLTDGKSRNTGAVWSNGGQWLAYGSTRRTGNDVDFYVVDPSNPKSDRLVGQNKGGGWSVEDWSPDDTQLLATEGLSINESYLWLIDVATGKTTELTPRGGGEGRVRQRGVREGRQGPLRDARSGLRVPAAGLHGPRLEEGGLPDARHRRRHRVRRLARREDDRLRDQREGRRASSASWTRPPARSSRGPSCRSAWSAACGGTRTAA